MKVRINIPFTAAFLAALLPAPQSPAAPPVEEDYYPMTTYTIPADLKLEASGLVALADGRLAIAIRKGEIWILQNPGEPERPDFRLFASGLHEPLGLAYRDGTFYTVQRTEITAVRDITGDGLADEYLTYAKGWGVTGNYHEYAYGPVFDFQGNAWITLNCTLGTGLDPKDNAWRGWSLKVTPDGAWQPVSGGFRSPSGVGLNLQGDVFATDQQGNWFPTCPLVHVRPGAFHGHADSLRDCKRPESTFPHPGELPKGLTVVQAAEAIPAYKLPAVWLPYRKMGMSSTDVLCDTTQGKFGPFAGQLFIGEFTMSAITRVFLEKVNGEYQGACFGFREGFQCAALRLAWDKVEGADGMFVGQSNRGWNSLGDRSYGLQRIQWTGRTPFEIAQMQARPDGFALRLTLPADPETARRKEIYQVNSYTYHYHERYGGSEIDQKQLPVDAVSLSQDGKSIRLVIPGLRAGYVHELRAEGLRSSEGLPLLHPLAAYTLNAIPQ